MTTEQKQPGTHTPGPWEVDELERSLAIIRDYPEGPVTLAWIDSPPNLETGEYDPEDVANARLIAAAPALLEALEAVRKGLVSIRDDRNFASAKSRAKYEQKRIDAAIALARSGDALPTQETN